MKRELDLEGLRLASYQAALCEASVNRCPESSPVFLRRLFYSKLCQTMDQGNSSLLSLDIDEGLDSIRQEFGPSTYGKTKYSEDQMFWIGWIYRYIAYTRNVNTRFVYQRIKPDFLRQVYYVYHTQDNEWAVQNIFEHYGLTEDDFDINELYKRYLKGEGK